MMWSRLCFFYLLFNLATVNGLTISKSKPKTNVLICPAQFCVPADYEDLVKSLESRDNVNKVKVAELPRTEWIKVARQLPTSAFFKGNLDCAKTLDWYFSGMENALSSLIDDDCSISIIGHSIGGWVARAYLGGLSRSSTSLNDLVQKKISSLVTLGTPHSSPDSALVDQTRGLLKQVCATTECSSESLLKRGIDVTCVCSSSVKVQISTQVESLVAFSSYLPLTGKLSDLQGDGIVPLELGFMDEPARRIEIEVCPVTQNSVRHANVFPTPWNLLDGYAASISLPEDFLWYGSDTIISKWVDYVR